MSDADVHITYTTFIATILNARKDFSLNNNNSLLNIIFYEFVCKGNSENSVSLFHL